MRRTRVVAILITLTALTPALRAAEPVLPRYHLEPGQLLTYTSSSKSEDDNYRSESTWKCYVLGKNDKGWDLLGIHSQSYSFGANSRDNKNVEVTTATLRSDGHLESNANAVRADLGDLFIPLPPDEKSLTAGYKNPWRDDGEIRIKPANPGDAALLFEAEITSPMNDIYLSTMNHKITFDTRQQLITAIERKSTQGWGHKSTSTGKMTLAGIETIPAAQLGKLKEDVRLHNEAAAKYKDATAKLNSGAAGADQEMTDAFDRLKKAVAAIETAQLKAPLELSITRHPQVLTYARGEAERQQAVLNKPAPAWTLTRIPDGRELSLADLKGKVIVLDFWYRGCGWCIRAMPQINTLTKDYRDRGVIVLGMNTDQQQDDAKFVMDKMQLTYETLSTPSDLPGKYGVQGFPTLVIIDQAGIIRHLHVGYSPTLRHEIGEHLDTLLKKPEAKAE